ncbi:MAG: F0F1 ATP synthase subunit epsilon [Phycisphaerales bacterium]|jgi:F-type H+-transporting ATPase subunit epsilon|nr:F0F1 ATP synthase subunit epsilon [Phycisphaerales bacterium]
MAPYKRPFHCEILTPLGSRCACDAVSVVFPAMDGQYGVMGGRTPLVTMLGVGVLSVEPVKGDTLEFFLSGGFATVRENTLVVLANECEVASEIDREEAWEAISTARAMADDTDEEFELRNEALDIARKRFALVQKKGKDRKEGHND